jgi:hypothetical protein
MTVSINSTTISKSAVSSKMELQDMVIPVVSSNATTIFKSAVLSKVGLGVTVIPALGSGVQQLKSHMKKHWRWG